MNKIVEWAYYGESIPLRCKECDALFRTKNIGKIGQRAIFPYSYFNDEFMKSIDCEESGHSIDKLEPFQELYNMQSKGLRN